MLSYILKRLLVMIGILIASSIIIFLIIKSAPGDPATTLLGENATVESIKEVNIKYGLDKPLHIQYYKMMKNLITGELISIYYKENVLKLVFQRLPATTQLGFFAVVLAVSVSLFLGIISAVKRNSIIDYISMSGAILGVSIPVFFTGIILMYIFGVKLKLLPASGYNGSLFSLEGFKYFILPGVSLSFVLMASTLRLTRSAMLDVLNEDYMRTARSKGLKESSIILKHALPNILIPVVTNVGNQIAAVFAGAILTETVFAWPGVGRLAVDAVGRRDEPLILGSVIILTGLYVLVNLIVDIVYVFINPQVKLK